MEFIHYHFKSLPSTNDWGKEHLSEFDPTVITLVSADEQSQGRGQYGKQWFAPAHLNLYASFCFLIEAHQKDPLSLTHVMAISAIHVLETCGVQPQIKWPNDILVSQKKISGILCETIPLSSQVGIVLGIGLNVNMPSSLLEAIGQPATSLLEETRQTWEIPFILEALKKRFAQDLAIFLKEGFSPFLSRFRALRLQKKELV